MSADLISRRDFLRLGGLALGSLFLAGCGIRPKDDAQIFVDFVNQYYQERGVVFDYYSTQTDYRKINIAVAKSKRVGVDTTNLQNIYKYFETIKPSTFSYSVLRNGITSVYDVGRLQAPSTSVFIVRPEDGLPQNVIDSLDSSPLTSSIRDPLGFTEFISPSGESVTIIRSDDPLMQNLILTTEACNSTLSVFPKSEPYMPESQISQVRQSLLIKDAYCVLFSTAVYSRYLGQDFSTFSSNREKTYRTITVKGNSYNIYAPPFDADLFNSVPVNAILVP